MPEGTRLLVAVAIGGLLLTGCASAETATTAADAQRTGEGELAHVHDVLVGADGAPVYLAAHTGLYELRNGEVVARSDRFDDLMAAAIEPDGTLIASGHPDLSKDELRVESKLPLLGLVESDDGSRWTPRSLLGDADFHALVVADGRLFGADSTSARVLVSDDGGNTWESRAGEAQLLDLVVDPSNPDRMVGVDLDRGLVSSDDGGDSWELLPDAPPLIDVEWTTSGALVAIDTDGSIRRSTDAGLTWETIASIAGAQALGTDGADLWVYAPPDGLHRSADDGGSWREITP